MNSIILEAISLRGDRMFFSQFTIDALLAPSSFRDVFLPAVPDRAASSLGGRHGCLTPVDKPLEQV